MSTSNCDCSIGCVGRAVVAGVIIGIITAVLRYTAVITLTSAFLWVLFGIAIGLLGFTLLASGMGSTTFNSCCKNLRAFLTGILGTVLTSVILLGITFAATSLLGAFISGLLLFFFTFMLVSAVCFILCNYNCK